MIGAFDVRWRPSKADPTLTSCSVDFYLYRSHKMANGFRHIFCGQKTAATAATNSGL